MFWLFSSILWLSRACTQTKFPYSYQKRWLVLSRRLTWLLGLQVPTPFFSSRLSLTVAFPWRSLTHICWLLWDLAFPCLLVSLEILRTSHLCVFRAKKDKGILWLMLTHTHTYTNKTNDHHRATLLYFIYAQYWIEEVCCQIFLSSIFQKVFRPGWRFFCF